MIPMLIFQTPLQDKACYLPIKQQIIRGDVKVKDLSPDALYYYRVWFVSAHGNKTESQVSATLTGSFSTSPNSSESELDALDLWLRICC